MDNSIQTKLFTHCLRCGRKLKDTISRQRGYGSICFGKMAASNSKPLFKPTKNNGGR